MVLFVASSFAIDLSGQPNPDVTSFIQYLDSVSNIPVLALGLNTGGSHDTSRLQSQLSEAVKGEREVVVDFADSSHLSGPALISVLRGLGFFNPFKAGPKVVLVNAPDHVIRALQLSGMASDVQTFDDIRQGVNFLVSQRS